MPFKKGKSGNPNGRQKGPNKATVEFKEAIKNLIEFATPKMVEWLSVVANEDPSRALEHIYKFAQFGYPLLSRTTHSGDSENPVVMQHTAADHEILNRYFRERKSK